eukprot:193150-Pyramimonas_sp.AAC.1
MAGGSGAAAALEDDGATGASPIGSSDCDGAAGTGASAIAAAAASLPASAQAASAGRSPTFQRDMSPMISSTPSSSYCATCSTREKKESCTSLHFGGPRLPRNVCKWCKSAVADVRRLLQLLLDRLVESLVQLRVSLPELAEVADPVPHGRVQVPSGRAVAQLIPRDCAQLDHVEFGGLQDLLGELRPVGAANARVLLAEEQHFDGEDEHPVDHALLEVHCAGHPQLATGNSRVEQVMLVRQGSQQVCPRVRRAHGQDVLVYGIGLAPRQVG